MSNNGSAANGHWVRTALSRYEGQLTRYAQRITGDLDIARDVVQETFLRLCREQPAELDGRLAEWLFTVCRNKAIDVRRRESRMTRLADTVISETPDQQPEPAAMAEQNESAGRAQQLVGNLPENQREVIRLKFQDGLSYREIAAVTGLSVSNVGFLIHRGVKTLREQMTSDR
ncbi:MAG: sigma-70 family RNA polymerase sigma factor [Planctomycetes bacterium]|nr:sigma-70 family RNA polymerase sigma factor [Planctomycetota bacterium]